jgi:hypothetical protein
MAEYKPDHQDTSEKKQEELKDRVLAVKGSRQLQRKYRVKQDDHLAQVCKYDPLPV